MSSGSRLGYSACQHWRLYNFLVAAVASASLLSPSRVSAGFENVAIGKHATMSGTNGNGTADHVVDGNYDNTDLNLCAAVVYNNSVSRLSGYAWWTVDLGDLFTIASVTIYGSAVAPDSTFLRKVNVYAHTLLNSLSSLAIVKAATPGANVTVTFPALNAARYITMYRQDSSKMTLCEVVVMGSRTITSPPENIITVGKPTNQSDTYKNRSASFAVDGNNDNTDPDKCATAYAYNISEGQFYAWWQVDLGDLYLINTVTMHIPTVFPDALYLQMYPSYAASVYVQVNTTSDFYSGSLCGYNHQASLSNGSLVLNCTSSSNTPVVGRFVTIQQSYGQYSSLLTLCEVEVSGVKQNISVSDPGLFGYRSSPAVSLPTDEYTIDESYRSMAIAAIVIASVFALFSIVMLVVCLLFMKGHNKVLKQRQQQPHTDAAEPNNYQPRTTPTEERSRAPRSEKPLPPTPEDANDVSLEVHDDDVYDDVVTEKPVAKKGGIKARWKK